jgi:hypothetical protein
VVPLLAGAGQANVVASMDGVEPRQTIVDPGVTARSVLVVTRLNRPRLRLLEHFEQALTDPKALPAAERCDLYNSGPPILFVFISIMPGIGPSSYSYLCIPRDMISSSACHRIRMSTTTTTIMLYPET